MQGDFSCADPSDGGGGGRAELLAETSKACEHETNVAVFAKAIGRRDSERKDCEKECKMKYGKEKNPGEDENVSQNKK